MNLCFHFRSGDLSPGPRSGMGKVFSKYPVCITPYFCFSSLDDDSHGESKLQHEQDKSNSLPVPSVSKRIVLGDSVCNMAGPADHAGSMVDLKGDKDLFSKTPELLNEGTSELRHRTRGELPSEAAPRPPRHGLEQYLSRFDEALKLRNQLMHEKPSQENGNAVEEFDSFRIFRLVGCALLAIAVRAFVCKYLVSSRKQTISCSFCYFSVNLGPHS